MFHKLVVSIATFLMTVGTAFACGPDTDCQVGDRTYRVALPSAPTGAAFIFVHGYQGTAAGAMGNGSLRRLAEDLGAVMIAVQAGANDWNIPGAPNESVNHSSDELAYFDAVMADATARFGVDPARTLVTGFSAGSMVVWNLACERGTSFAGFAPVSGTFWAPTPTSCPTGPVNLIHYHGDADTTVPMEGRAIGPAHQGSVTQAFALMTATGGYGPAVPRAATDLTCNRQTDPAGHILELCMFAGGHSFKTSFVADAWAQLGIDRSR